MRNDEGRTFLSFVRRLAIVMSCLVGWFALLVQNSCKEPSDGLQAPDWGHYANDERRPSV
jgi:hypothetical protein